jgi:hypothetical protein
MGDNRFARVVIESIGAEDKTAPGIIPDTAKEKPSRRREARGSAGHARRRHGFRQQRTGTASLQPSKRRRVIMNHLSPHRIGKMEADSRSLKEGWYAANKIGHICSGRFSDQATCQAHITQERTDIDTYHQGAVHYH